MGIAAPGGTPPTPEAMRAAAEALRRFPDLDLALEMMLRRMVGLLFIEVSAFHTFAWAEEVLSDTDLVAGDGEAAELVRYIRADETPHVEYLRTALTEMRDRTFVGESGRQHRRHRGDRHALGRRARAVARRRTARTSARRRWPRSSTRSTAIRAAPRSSRASTPLGDRSRGRR